MQIRTVKVKEMAELQSTGAVYKNRHTLCPVQAASSNQASWYLAYTRPRMENTALSNLEQQGFRAYVPMYKTFRRSTTGLQACFEPLFPRYIFLSPSSPRQSLATVSSTKGICHLVRFGAEAARVEPELLDHIRDFERQRNEAHLDTISPIQPGTRVRIRHNALRGMEGLVVSIAKHRVTFLLQVLGREKQITVEHTDLELA